LKLLQSAPGAAHPATEVPATGAIDIPMLKPETMLIS